MMQKAVDRQTLFERSTASGGGAPAHVAAEANHLSDRSADALAKAAAAATGALAATLLPWLCATAAWASGMRAEASACVLATSLVAASIGYFVAFIAARAHHHAPLAMTALLSLAALSQMPFDAEAMIAAPSAAGSPFGLAAILLQSAGLALAALAAALVPRPGMANHARWTWTTAAVVLLAYPLLVDPTYALDLQARIWMAAFVAGMSLVAAADLIKARTSAQPSTTPLKIALSPRLALHIAMPAAVLPPLLDMIATITAPLAMPASLMVGMALLVALVASRRAATSAGSTLALIILASLVAATAMLASPSALAPLLGLVIGIAAFLAAIYVNGPRFAHATPMDALIGLSIGTVAGILLPHVPMPTGPLTLTLLAALCAAPGMTSAALSPLSARRLLAVVLLSAAAAMIAETAFDAFGTPAAIALAALAVPLALWLVHHSQYWHERNLALVAAVSSALLLLPSHWQVAQTATGTWATARLLQNRDASQHQVLAGTSIVGHEPSTPPSAIAQSVAVIRRAKPVEFAANASGATPLLIGIVGASSTSACATASGDVVRYFEVDTAVAKLAANDRWLSTSSRCAPAARIIPGDPRRTLAAEPDEAFDLLVIDAGSTAAPPLHLLTGDMLAILMAKLSPSGVLALQVARAHLDLAPWIAQQIAPLRGVNAVRVGDDIILLSRNAAIIEQIAVWPDANGVERVGGTSVPRHVPLLPAITIRSKSAF